MTACNDKLYLMDVGMSGAILGHTATWQCIDGKTDVRQELNERVFRQR